MGDRLQATARVDESPRAGKQAGTESALVAPSAKAVFLAVELNDWNTTATPIERQAGDKWSVTLSLPPRKYGYKFFVDGRWLPDPKSPDQMPDGFGGKNSVVFLRDPDAVPVISRKRHLTRRRRDSSR